jgi:hypothetical protein
MKILFFSPHAFFSVHALPEALVAEALVQAGHEIYMVTCDGLYRKHCLCMSQVDFADQAKKEKICAACKTNRNQIASEFRFPTLELEAYLSRDDAEKADALVNSLDRANFLQFEWGGILVAKYAMYEFWLNHKLSSEDIEPDLWPEYLAIFENTLKTLLAIQRMIADVKPERLVCYNALYSVNRVVAALGERESISYFTLHAGRNIKHRLQQMTIYRSIGYGVALNRLPIVDAYRASACTPEQINMVTDHVQELFKATSLWVYSIKSNKLSSTELYGRFAITENKKVLLAVMRSNDEQVAARFTGVEHYQGSPLFADQYQWISWLVEFGRLHPEYVIILRVHPREFPNKREGVTSQNANKFMNYIQELELPENFHINLPRDNLSLHDLLKITDVMLNSTSTAGLEACLFGIPVVGCGDELYAFDLALQAEPESIEDYTKKINDACTSKWSFSRVIGAYRWLNFLDSETAISIADGYDPSRKANKKPKGRIPKLLWKLRRRFGLGRGFAEVSRRPRPLLNADKLVYAIVNNQDSHVGAFAMDSSGDPIFEREQIAQAYAAYMESIRNPEDLSFRSRIDRCLANH